MERIAHGLRQNYDIGSNGPNTDVVTVISHGQPLVAAAFYGVIAAGGVYSAASPSSTVAELARQVKIGTSRLIICSSEFKELATQAAKQCNVPLNRILVLESSPSWRLSSLYGGINAISTDKLSWEKITDPQRLKKSLITILWSSGTTGLPKGRIMRYFNLSRLTAKVLCSPMRTSCKRFTSYLFPAALGHRNKSQQEKH